MRRIQWTPCTGITGRLALTYANDLFHVQQKCTLVGIEPITARLIKRVKTPYHKYDIIRVTKGWLLGVNDNLEKSFLKRRFCMSLYDIEFSTLKEVVASLGSVFFTKDVSEDSRMMHDHLDQVDKRNYHSFVGGALSDHKVQLEIEENKKGTKRGSLWQKIKSPGG